MVGNGSKLTNKLECPKDFDYAKIGYFLCEYLRHGDQYGDKTLLIEKLPFPLSKKFLELTLRGTSN